LFLALTKPFSPKAGSPHNTSSQNALSGAGTGAMSEATIVESIIARHQAQQQSFLAWLTFKPPTMLNPGLKLI
jgi:hypothetical protein